MARKILFFYIRSFVTWSFVILCLFKMMEKKSFLNL